MSTTPLVSVVMASYNHAPYVRAAIDSVLSQQEVEVELLIEDDGSTDNTAQVIQQVKDERVQFFPKAANEGACASINNVIRRARGEYIALINSDDVWQGTDKLALQLDLLQTRPEVAACFGRASFIGPDGAPLGLSLHQNSVFDQANRSRALWLRRFFEEGNCLCHPTVMIRKRCYDELGLYDNRLRQLPDFEMWIRLVKRHEIHVCEQPLVQFRLVPGQNTSAATPVNIRRILNEQYLLLLDIFDDVTPDMFREASSDVMVNPDPPTPADLEIEKTLLYFKAGFKDEGMYRAIGLEKLYRLLGSDEHRRILVENYSVDDRWLHDVMSEHSSFAPRPVPAQPQATPTPPPSRTPAAPAKSSLPLARYLSFLRR